MLNDQVRPKRFAQVSRRRLDQIPATLNSIMTTAADAEDVSLQAEPLKSNADCLRGAYRVMWTKYIQLKSLPRRTRILIFLGLVSLSILVVVDRLTTKTMSSSKWARMMYEDNEISKMNMDGSEGKIPSTITSRIERPRDLHIAFVGDSVTRYMYLDLVYFLRHDRWVHDEDFPNILNAKHYPSWNDHYSASNRALSPNEVCDCFRNNPKNSSHIDKEETIENRYYADPELNNYATFIEVFGGYQAHGHVLPQDAYPPLPSAPPQDNQKQPYQELDFDKLQTDPFVWRHDWPGLIQDYLTNLTPKPDYLVFNEGLWVEHELGDEQVRQSIKDALDETGIIGIYKTTTLPNINSGLAKRSAGVVFNRHDDAMCEVIGNCLDFTWTKDLGDEHYWDGVHFKPHVNRGMNMELLDFLDKLKKAKREKSPALKGTPQ